MRSSRDRTRAGAIAVAVASFAVPRAAAHAEPNVTVGLTVGGGAGERPTGGVAGAFHLGGRASAMFLRARDADMGIGPYVDVGTTRFDGVDLGGGVEWLVPVTEHLPIVVSAGPFARKDALGWHGGTALTLFGGSRSLNYHSVYGLAAGVFVQGRMLLDGPPRAEVVAGAQLDVLLLALPFVLAVNAVR